MKLNKFYLLMTVPFLLISCNNTTNDSFQKIICPKGAPAVAYYDQGNNSNFVTAVATNVKSQLLSDSYGSVVFDFYNGLNVLKNKKNYDENSDFKLARIITGGNFYLVGIETENEPTSASKIISFNKNSLPDLVYKKVYGDDIYNATSHVADNEAAAAVLRSGLYEGEHVNYVLIAEPALFAAMNDSTIPTYGKINVIASLRTKWFELTGQNYIPQAGLFIRQNYFDKYHLFFDDQMGLLNERIDTCVNDPSTMKRKMDEITPNILDQKTIFGMTSEIAYQVSKTNRLSLVVEEHSDIDVHEFLTQLGITTDFSKYLLNKR